MRQYNKDINFWEDQFISLANTPVAWIITAKKLKASYNVLAEYTNKMFESIRNAQSLEESLDETLPASLMLAGYAMENYLKGIIIQTNPGCALNEKGKFTLKSHILIELASQANLQLNNDEQELLEIIHHFVIVGGRYPIPLKKTDMQLVHFNNGNIGPIGLQYYDHVRKRYLIYEKIDLFFDRLEVLCNME